MNNRKVTFGTIGYAIAELIRIWTGAKKHAEEVAILRSSGDWETIEQNFHDHWAENIDQDQIEPEMLFNSPTALEFRYAGESLGQIAGKRVLDLGCGAGEAAIYFALHGACVTAIDISPKMVEITNRLAHRHGVQDRLNALVASAEFLPLGTQCVDLVFGSSVLHHVDLPGAVSEVKRVLRPEGKAVFIEPLAYNPVIEVYRHMADQVRTPTEIPVAFDDLTQIRSSFSNVRHTEFHLFTLLIFIWFFIGERLHPNADRYWKKFVRSGDRYITMFKLLRAWDVWALEHLPFLRQFCWATVIECANGQRD